MVLLKNISVKKRNLLWIIGIVGIVISIAYAQNISVKAGYITKANLYSEISTWRWGGIIGYVTPGTLPESPDPFLQHSITAGVIDMINVSASNLKDGKHYFAALPYDTALTINVSKMRNITENDLEEFGIFNATNFPIFHPNYYQNSDNPKTTFCCYNETILISGKPFTAFRIVLKNNVRYYLLKYQFNDSYALPLFLVNISDYTCYDSSTCQFEFMLPADKTYQLYVLSKEPAYDIKVFVDGVETTDIPNTGLPYNITTVVYDIYTQIPVPNKTIVVFEDNGNNIFSPLPIISTTSRVMAYTESDSKGRVQFIISPTPTLQEAGIYSLKVGILSTKDIITNQKTLNILDMELKGGKKYISPTELLDNSKATVVYMIQLEDSVYNWAQQRKANKYTIFVDTSGSYTIRNESDELYYSSASIQTGAVNYISVILRSGGVDVPGYVVPEETAGFIVMNPTYNPPVVGPKNHTHKVFYIPTGTGFVIAPTKMGPANSEVKLYVYDSNYYLVATIPLYIDKSTTITGNAVFYQNDDMQAKIVKTIQVINTLYYAYW